MIDGRKVKSLRVRIGWTLQRLGGKVGCRSPGTIHKIECGQSFDPRLSTVLGICHAIGCTVEALLTDDAKRKYAILTSPAVQVDDGVGTDDSTRTPSWDFSLSGLRELEQQVASRWREFGKLSLAHAEEVTGQRHYVITQRRAAELLVQYADLKAWAKGLGWLDLPITRLKYDPVEMILDLLNAPPDRPAMPDRPALNRDRFRLMLRRFAGTSVNEAIELLDVIERAVTAKPPHGG